MSAAAREVGHWSPWGGFFFAILTHAIDFGKVEMVVAVALGRTYLSPPSGGALVVQPWLRFHIPLIEPDMRISRTRLSDKNSLFRVQRLLQFLTSFRS